MTVPGGNSTAATLTAMAELSQADLDELVEEATAWTPMARTSNWPASTR